MSVLNLLVIYLRIYNKLFKEHFKYILIVITLCLILNINESSMLCTQGFM